MGACPRGDGHGQAVVSGGPAWTQAGWAGSQAGVEQFYANYITSIMTNGRIGVIVVTVRK